jgi:hypothetical protein
LRFDGGEINVIRPSVQKARIVRERGIPELHGGR